MPVNISVQCEEGEVDFSKDIFPESIAIAKAKSFLINFKSLIYSAPG
jgi:hypothetical protein